MLSFYVFFECIVYVPLHGAPARSLFKVIIGVSTNIYILNSYVLAWFIIVGLVMLILT